jgi:hypothetical protein
MTAVQWALDQQHTLFALRELGGIDDYEYFNRSSKILEKAMEMEKEQMIELWNIAVTCESFEQYYNETFKSE